MAEQEYRSSFMVVVQPRDFAVAVFGNCTGRVELLGISSLRGCRYAFLVLSARFSFLGFGDEWC